LQYGLFQPRRRIALSHGEGQIGYQRPVTLQLAAAHPAGCQMLGNPQVIFTIQAPQRVRREQINNVFFHHSPLQ
jgi:hypothetical protein